jgi:hypothetical protein
MVSTSSIASNPRKDLYEVHLSPLGSQSCVSVMLLITPMEPASETSDFYIQRIETTDGQIRFNHMSS